MHEIIESSYGDPRLRMKGATPWERRPEQSEWVEFEVRRYEDGSEVRWERSCGRWTTEYQEGEWFVAGERRANLLEAELVELRTYVALYLHTLDKPGTQPSRRLREAPNPASHARVWRPYLEREAAKAPRIKE